MPPSIPSTTTTLISSSPATQDQTPKPDQLRGMFTLSTLPLSPTYCLCIFFAYSPIPSLFPLILLLFSASLLSLPSRLFSPSPVPLSKSVKSQQYKYTLLTSRFHHQEAPARSASSCNGRSPASVLFVHLSVRPTITAIHPTLQPFHPSLSVFLLACTTYTIQKIKDTKKPQNANLIQHPFIPHIVSALLDDARTGN